VQQDEENMASWRELYTTIVSPLKSLETSIKVKIFSPGDLFKGSYLLPYLRVLVKQWCNMAFVVVRLCSCNPAINTSGGAGEQNQSCPRPVCSERG